MSKFEIVMPKLGESIQEGTITKWFVKEGDTVEEDDVLFEVATDKVDSEIPSPVDGVVAKILHGEDTLVAVGDVVATINTEGEIDEAEENDRNEKDSEHEEFSKSENGNVETKREDVSEKEAEQDKLSLKKDKEKSKRFYSPLVISIAKKENVSFDELENIEGSGTNGRVRKKDILEYIAEKEKFTAGSTKAEKAPVAESGTGRVLPPVSVSEGDKVIEMDRVRKLIADHMVMSKKVSPHVTTVVEADVTELVFWRNRNKEDFQQKYGEKITFMPFFIEAVAAALTGFPMVNSSVDGHNIILRKNINIGIAVAKKDGNLIVPVIKNAEQKNLVGLTKELNRVAEAARSNKLTPEEIQGGTFTITNFGTFRNLFGAPIINQPQAAILATGSIEKKPSVMETPTGDAIVIRHKMFLSLSYDHRVVDGALGGAFLRKVADNLEQFDPNRSI